MARTSRHNGGTRHAKPTAIITTFLTNGSTVAPALSIDIDIVTCAGSAGLLADLARGQEDEVSLCFGDLAAFVVGGMPRDRTQSLGLEGRRAPRRLTPVSWWLAAYLEMGQ